MEPTSLNFRRIGSPVISDLGDLVDDPMNKEMTIHSPCTNSGGDLVADDAGHLFLVTGYNKVYKVDIATRTTTFLATISGLPQKFTTSGVAVGEDGKQLIITSSVYSDAYFLVDPRNMDCFRTTNSAMKNMKRPISPTVIFCLPNLLPLPICLSARIGKT